MKLMKQIFTKIFLVSSLVLLISANAYASIPQKSKVSANDSTGGYLNGKIVAGTGITVTENNDGGNETLTITNGLGTADGAAESLFIEGASANNFEQILRSVDPTADRVFYFPDAELSAGDLVVGISSQTATYLNLGNTQIVIGDGSGAPTAASLSGDVTMTNAGVVTIGGDKVALTTDTTGNYLASLTAADLSITVTGGSGEGATPSIAVAANGIDGTHIALGSDAAGDIMYYNGTNYVRLPKGTNGEFLSLAAGLPDWATPAGGGDMLAATYDANSNNVVDEVDQIGTLTNTKWCSSDGLIITCMENAPSASTGDVESAGDCTSGACYDGSSDGGTYVRLYDGDSHYNAIVSPNIAANITTTLPAATGTLATLAGTETFTNKTLTSPKINEDVAVTATATEINYTDGVTSAIQTQLDAKDAVTTAGRSLTRTTNDFAADPETYTDTKCIRFENPVAADDLKSIWMAKNAFTLTSIWAESDQTVTFMLQVDDGSPADVDSVDLAPAAGTAEDTALNGDATMAAGDRLDIDLVSTSGTPTYVSICWTGTWDD